MDVAVTPAGVQPAGASQSRTGSVMSRNTLIAACVACLVAGYLVACVPRLLARLAKLGLWVMVFAEPAPQVQYRAAMPKSDDATFVCHAEGW